MDLIERMAKTHYEKISEKRWVDLPELTREVFYDAMFFAVMELRSPPDEILQASADITARALAEIRMLRETGDPTAEHMSEMRHRWTAMVDRILGGQYGPESHPEDNHTDT